MRYLAVDLESWKIEPGNLTPKPVVVSWYQDPKNWAGSRTPPSGLMLPDAAANWLMELLRDQDLTLIGANSPYDMAVMAIHYPALMPLVFQAYDEGRIVCVQTLQKLVDISQGCRERPRQDGTVGYSLATLVRHYKGLDRTADKEGERSWRLRYSELEGVPLEQWPPEAVSYAENDAMDTWDVYHQQRRTYGIMPSETEQYRAAFALHLMSCQGIRTDGAKVAALKERLLLDRAAQRFQSKQAGFLKLTPCKPDEEAEALVPYKRGDGQRKMRWGRDMTAIKNRVRVAYAALGKEVPQTEGGGVSTDADTLDRSKDPALQALAASGTTEKLLSTYIPALEQGVNTKVNTRFNVLVDNGRTSSHKDKATGAGFNFQNFPRPNELDANAGVNFVRPCIVPTEGTYFCSIDLDAGELRSLAQVQLYLFGKSKLADVLNAGRDPHLEFAADLLGIGYEEALANKKRPDVKKARQYGKIFNFGKPGGLGIASMVDFARTNYGVDMSTEEAERLTRKWERTYPEMRRYLDYISRLVGEGGARIKSFGSGMLRGDVGYTDAANHFFSNLIAQGVKDACFYIAWECYVDKGTPLYGARQVAMIHDETILELPVATAHEAAHRAAELFREHVQLRMPDVKVTASPALSLCWEKDAAPVFIEGRLVPWTKVC